MTESECRGPAWGEDGMHEADQTKEQLIEKLTKAIADQRKMARALRRSEEQYRCVVDHIGSGSR